MTQPPRPSSGGSILQWCQRLWDYAMSLRPIAGPGITLRTSKNGTIISAAPGKRGSGSGSGPCNFGELYQDGEDTKIRGGWISCGDKNFNVAGHTVNLATDGDWLIQIELTGIDPATDDDDEIFLPGIITATGTPAWEAKTNTEGTTHYDDHTNPTTPAGTGTVHIPIGRLVIADGVATLSPVDCGNVTIGQCAGILSVSRT